MELGADYDGNSTVTTKAANIRTLGALDATAEGAGMVTTYRDDIREQVKLTANANGGMIEVFNNGPSFPSEVIADSRADEYGNGVVGACNRKGRGRTLQPGP